MFVHICHSYAPQMWDKSIVNLVSIFCHMSDWWVSGPADTPQVSVSVWPPGSNIYLGECLLLQCTVESNSSSGWSYRWSRRSHASVPAPNPRHLVSGNTYSITAVTKDDAGSYRCQAKSNKSSVVLFSRPTTFSVSGELIMVISGKQDACQVHIQQKYSQTGPDVPTKGWNYHIINKPEVQ